MKVAVLTGSTRGIGFGLARELARRGCRVVVSGRTAKKTAQAAASLAAEFGADRALGFACDVSVFGQVQALWDAAVARFGRVDIWINNAGISHPSAEVDRIEPETMRAIVATNVLGAVHGAAVALRGMRAQGSGAIYNLEGLGSDGRRMRGLALYGMTKRALAYLTDSLADEAKGSGVIAGAIRPGMVMTDMITSQYVGREEEWRRAQRIFRLIAAPVEDVAPWVAERVLANRRNRARIQYGGMLRILGRMIAVTLKRKH
jgi:NAD(P)-dependent dehydrogenase (short-subunit alcohol dehydrogenase family)